MSFRLNLVSGSNWYMTTIGDAAGASGGLPGLSKASGAGISIGGYAGWFEVTSRLHTADVYRCYYAVGSGEIGAGGSLLGAVTVSGSSQYHPSGALGPIYRTGPLSPDGSGEGGDPTGFLGMCMALTPSGGIGNQLYGTYLMLGPPRNWQESIARTVLPLPMQFKYAAIFGGAQFSTAASISFAVQPGLITQIWNQTTGRQVTLGGSSTIKR
jgi:hypothetical protein